MTLSHPVSDYSLSRNLEQRGRGLFLLEAKAKVRGPYKKKRRYDLMSSPADAAQQLFKRRKVGEEKGMVIDDSASIRQGRQK